MGLLSDPETERRNRPRPSLLQGLLGEWTPPEAPSDPVDAMQRSLRPFPIRDGQSLTMPTDTGPLLVHTLPDVDLTSGAPSALRLAVGYAETPRDRLATVRRYAPDARPFGDDNFVYTDPRTGRPTVYSPAGLDWGDVHSLTPMAADLVGGVAGAAIGTALMGGPAVVAAAPTGGLSFLTLPAAAALGAAGGRQAMRLMLGPALGTIDTRGPGPRLLDAAQTVAGGMAFSPVTRTASRIAGEAIAPVRRTAERAADAVITQGRRLLTRRPPPAE